MHIFNFGVKWNCGDRPGHSAFSAAALKYGLKWRVCFGVSPNSLAQNEVFIITHTDTHRHRTHTNNSTVAINTELNRFECFVDIATYPRDENSNYPSKRCVLEPTRTPDLLSVTSNLTIMTNWSLPFSMRHELQLKRRSTYIKKDTLWTSLEFSIIVWLEVDYKSGLL